MDPYQNGESSNTNLLSILINMAFGFVAALVLFFGVKPVLLYATKIAQDVITYFGFQSLPGYGLVTNFLPYLVLTPIIAMALRQLASVRSIRGFIYFVLAIGLGFAIAYYNHAYFVTVL
jgi:hypothetical protein